MEWETTRERMMKLLSEASTPLSARDIALELGLDSERAVYEELKHVAKSIRRSGKRLYIQPAYCRKCGYVFKDAQIKRPSKCPRCKSQWIEPPRFIIR
ncbi:MAG: transcriptional regulator [Crenarchaeota archaeon]|nr:transcriptional regulator [Thermoproteota archaeon]